MENKEVISNRQAISLIILFILGEGSIYIEGIVAKNDLWLSYIMGLVFSLPVVIMFARLLYLFPGKNLFDIIDICFGRFFGKLLIIIFTWYMFHAVAITMDDLSFFLTTEIFTETPRLILIICFFAICVIITKNGIEVMGRWAEIFVIVPIVLIISITLLLFPKIELQNVTPVLYNGFKPVLKGAFLTFIFPFTYIVGFTMIFNLSKRKNSPYKIYLTGLLIGAAFLFIIYMLVIFVIGPYQASNLYYPTYIVVSLINIGDFLQRLDIIAAIIYLIGLYIQTSVFLLGACKGIVKLFGFTDYRFLLMPVVLLLINLSSYECDSVMKYFDFGTNTWSLYVFPFEVILPFIIWVVAEIRVKKIKKSNFRIS